MKIGYMVDFREKLIKEIGFARNNFDFIEITLKKRCNFSGVYTHKLKRLLKNFLVIGHIHWDLGFSKIKDYEEIIRSVDIFSLIGAKEIVIHPDKNLGLNENAYYLIEIKEYCKKQGIELVLENVVRKFHKFGIMSRLLKKTNLTLALDTGHANRISGRELKRFFKLNDKIKHIHLNNNIGKVDHLGFSNNKKLSRIITEIKKLNRKVTISLEIFRKFNKKEVDLESRERKEFLLKQKELILSLSSS